MPTLRTKCHWTRQSVDSRFFNLFLSEWLAWKVHQVLHKVLWEHLGADDLSAKGRPVLNLVPQSTMLEFYLPLGVFNVGSNTKNGCAGFKSSFVLLCFVGKLLFRFWSFGLL